MLTCIQSSGEQFLTPAPYISSGIVCSNTVKHPLICQDAYDRLLECLSALHPFLLELIQVNVISSEYSTQNSIFSSSDFRKLSGSTM